MERKPGTQTVVEAFIFAVVGAAVLWFFSGRVPRTEFWVALLYLMTAAIWRLYPWRYSSWATDGDRAEQRRLLSSLHATVTICLISAALISIAAGTGRTSLPSSTEEAVVSTVDSLKQSASIKSEGLTLAVHLRPQKHYQAYVGTLSKSNVSLVPLRRVVAALLEPLGNVAKFELSYWLMVVALVIILRFMELAPAQTATK